MSEDSHAYIVRLLTPADAEGVPELTSRVYGPAYFHREAFNPEELLEKNRAGELTSAIAIDPSGHVVAHCALERPNHERFAKVGEAMVLPEHRQHHLLADMGSLLFKEARIQGVVGIYAEPVTHHVFSQRAFDAIHGVPTGVRLGAWAIAGFGIDFPQRITPVVYFRYFAPPPKRTLYVPQVHRELATRIFTGLRREVEFGDAQKPQGSGEVLSSYDPEHASGFIRVIEAGRDSVRRVLEAQQSLNDQGAEAIFVDIFVDQPSSAMVCEELEHNGFFFSGIQPDIKQDRDLLRLQLQRTSIDLKLVHMASDLGREILSYIGAERDSLNKS